ncbi:hypothetical protein [Flavobacterium frigoris]|uniref:Uncharacterized protein n=1 Tax=Flavobacterium frigoris TaxID=229204 RepID=A0A1H9CI39_FLAFI|nr:hypothetical protein [Flavobacterium frigoris]SEQ00824.1 hypothetical protein SAMN05444355_101180 [Flavobacterium frigoris]
MKLPIITIILTIASISSYAQAKDTLFFKIDKQYTISPTITPNLSNRTYTEYVKVARQQKLQTKTNGYIYFVGNGHLTKGLKPRKILSIKEYIENRKFYCDGNHNKIIDKWKLKDSLTDKFVIFFVNGDEFIQPRHLQYQSYYPIRQDEKIINNPIKDTLYFKLDNSYLYESEYYPGEYITKDSSGSSYGTFFLKKIVTKQEETDNTIQISDFEEFVHNSRFYDKSKTQKLQDQNLSDFLSNYVLFLVKNTPTKNEYIKVYPSFAIE